MLFSTTSLSSSSKERAVAKAVALIFNGLYRTRGRLSFRDVAELSLRKGYKAFSITGKRFTSFYALEPFHGRWRVWERLRLSLNPPKVALRPIYRERKKDTLSAPSLPKALSFLCRGLYPTYRVVMKEGLLTAPFLSVEIRGLSRVGRVVSIV